MVMYLFYHGVECQKAFNKSGGSALATKKPAEGEAKPSPMLVVTDLSFELLSPELEKVNKTLKDDAKVCIGLINGPGRYVIVGPTASMAGVKKHLDKYQKNSGNDFVMDFLNTTMAFHSSLLESAVGEIMKIVKDAPSDSPLKKIAGMSNRDVKFPVYSTVNGKNLQDEWNLLECMCRMQSVEVLDWPATTAALPDASKPTFALDFGPGGARGVVALSTKIFKEKSMHFFCASKYTPFKPKEESAVAHPKMLTVVDSEEFVYSMPAMVEHISDCPFSWQGEGKADLSKGLCAFEGKNPKLLNGAFRSLPEAKKKVELDNGKKVKVITDVDNIFSWCRARFIDSEFDSKRKTVAGQVVQVIDTDDSDNTIKVKSGGTEVWIPIQAAMAA
jgi:malonyl CoA-acyl carrier protein transacylase